MVDYLGSDGKSLVGQATYLQKRPITLVVSAGPLPPVANHRRSRRRSAVDQGGLKPQQGSEQYCSTVAAGNVIGIDPQTTRRASAGSSGRDSQPVLLITSRGPQPVEVPNVVGMTWTKAKAALSAAGFVLTYNSAADAAPNFFTVQSVTPGYPSVAPKGSTLTIKFNGF